MGNTEIAEAPAKAATIDVREAVQAARAHFEKLYQGAATLEETELTEDGRYWLITLGFLDPWASSVQAARREDLSKKRTSSDLYLQLLKDRRDKLALTYKRFTVDARTGRVVSMKIREVE